MSPSDYWNRGTGNYVLYCGCAGDLICPCLTPSDCTVDTYHAYFIIKYHHKTLKRRKKRGLPPLSDENDLPNNMANNHDLEMAGHAQDIVLSDEEQALLAKHQAAFHKSHSECSKRPMLDY